MNHGLWVKAALLSAALLGFARAADAAEDLTLRRVMLSTGGVGYFEYEAKVTGDARIPLSVRLDQVDDVLKSVIIYDNSGNLGEITLPGKDLVREVFRDLPFSEGALDSAAALIGALRGAEVRVEIHGSVVSGRIVSVTSEQAKLPSGETVTRRRLTLESEGAVRQVILEEITSLKFVDAAVQRQIDEALSALAQRREQGQRALSIHIAGSGERLVRVAYVAAVPLWKTTYRLVLSSDTEVKTAGIEGFAVVENRSGKDWNRVDLTLLSGDPVTFRQALYEAYYVTRPEVPVDMVDRVLPRLDEGATAMMARRRPVSLAAHGERGEIGEAAALAFAPSEDAPQPIAITPAESREATTQVIFHLPSLVSLADGQSALLPVINRELPADRWSLYQPDVNRRHPLSSVRLTNKTDSDLPPGALSVYERSGAAGSLTYVGDARLAPLPVGEERTVSFAVDQRVKIDKDEQSAQTFTTATIVDGVLTVTRTWRQTTTYTIVGAAREARSVVIEHPRLAGWEIAEAEEGSDQPFEVTATHYRFRKDVPAGQTAKVKVTLKRPYIESVTIANLSDEQIATWVSSTELTPAVHAAFARLATLRAAVAEQQATVNRLEAERKQITEDQARIRENLKAIPTGSDLARSYLATLTEEEARLRALSGELKAAQDALAKAKQALAEYVRRLRA